MAHYSSLTIFAPYFPPRERVGAIRPYRFAKYLSKLGWKVSVICIGDSNANLTHEQASNLKDVSIHRLNPPLDRTTSKKTVQKSTKKKNKGQLLDWFDKQFPIDTWYPFLLSKKGEIESILIEEKTDLLLSTSDPWSSAVVAERISAAMNIPWVADFRDPWTLCDTRFRTKGATARYFEELAEKKIMEQANFLTFTSKETHKKYVNRYSGIGKKSATIRNSFDTTTSMNVEKKSSSHKKIRILFLGTFRALSTAESIISLLKILKNNNRELFDKIEVHSFGELENSDKISAEKEGVAEKFIVRDKVLHAEIQNEIDKAEILLLSTKPERNDIIPAKLFDYLPSGKPILSLVDNKEVKDIIEETRSGLHAGINNFESAISFIEDIATSSYIYDSDHEKIESYSAKFRAKELHDILLKVMNNG